MHKTVTNHSNNIIKKYYCIRKHNNANQFFKINNLAEPIFLFKMGLSYLISKRYLILSMNFLFLFAKMVNSSEKSIGKEYHKLQSPLIV